MMKQLLDEVKSAPLDDAARARLAGIHERSIKELEDGLAPELVEELERITLPFPADGTPSDAELRIAQAQLVGWLEGLFHGIQTALAAQHAARDHAAAQAQLRQLPPGTVIAPGVIIGENGEPQRAAAPRPGADHLAGLPYPRTRTTAPASTCRAPLGFFSAARQGRKDDAELGKGLWRRAHDRFTRGLDRYHQVLEGVEDDALYAELLEIANELSGALRAGPAGLRGGPAACTQRGTRHSRGPWPESTAPCPRPATPWRPRPKQRRCSGSPSVPSRPVRSRSGAAPTSVLEQVNDAERRLAEAAAAGLRCPHRPVPPGQNSRLSA